MSKRRGSLLSPALGMFAVLIISSLMVGGLASSVSAQASTVIPGRLLVAVGTADVRVTPDLAEVQLGVVTEATTATAAREQNASKVKQVIAAIRKLGIAENAIRTSMFQLEPIRRYDPQNPQAEPPITGYRVSNIVTVRTANLNQVSQIIDEGIRAGANRVDNVSFTISDQSAATQRALRDAIADARANADAMARELRVALVRVYSVQQGGATIPPPIPMYRGGVAEAMAATPIFPGEMDVTATVTVTWEIR